VPPWESYAEELVAVLDALHERGSQPLKGVEGTWQLSAVGER
jgi:hypothetical protein